MDRKYHALVCCRAGMGSSMMLKIKCDQVIKEDNLPIETEHGNLDSIIGFRGDLVITMIDLTEELSQDPAFPPRLASRTSSTRTRSARSFMRGLTSTRARSPAGSKHVAG